MKRHSFLLFFTMALLVSCNGKVGQNIRQDEIKTGKSEIITSETIVQTQSGKVAGYTEEGISIYKGIPYAEAGRFMPPQEPKAWMIFNDTCEIKYNFDKELLDIAMSFSTRGF
jgi:para-nitrobenzyl esterase